MKEEWESSGTIAAVHRRPTAETGWLVADAMVGMVVEPARRGIGAAVALSRTLRPLTDRAVRPPLLPERYWPARLMHRLADAGRGHRRAATLTALGYFRRLVPVVLTEILDQLDLTALIRDRIEVDLLINRIDSKRGTGPRIENLEAEEAVAAWVDRVFHR